MARSRLKISGAAVCLFVSSLAQAQFLSTRIGKLPNEAPPISTSALARPADQSDSATRRESSISGRIIDESGQPLANAAVYVRKVGRQANVNRSIGTDQDGRFRADDLTSGPYLVSAYAPGYVAATDSVERQYYRPGDAVTLRMTKGAVITGTVTNADGEPLVAARVSAIRVRDGEGRAMRGAGLTGVMRQTDDRGVYRLYGLQSGSYLIAVNGGFGSYYPSSAYDGDAPTYHPSTTRDAAAEVAVHAGDEVRGIDVRYRGDRGHIVSGTLAGSLGSDQMGGVSVSLARAASGAIESITYAPLRGGERGFALYGVADGEYDLVAQMGVGTENSAASAPRRVVVKGADVTGLDLSLAPLGAISGRVVLEALLESERKGDCKDKRGASPDEAVIIARRDEKASAKEPSPPRLFDPPDGAPDEKGEFKISSLVAGRYRIQLRLPTEDWFVRSIAVPGPPASKQQTDVTSAGLQLGSGQRVADLTVTIAEGAAALRGKVVPAAASASLPLHLRVHVVPAEAESADVVVRYAEIAVDNDGAFSILNLAPGRYFLLARAVSDAEYMEREPRAAAWDAASRMKLWREAEAANIALDLQRCQRVADYSLKYSPPAGTKKPAPRTRP